MGNSGGRDEAETEEGWDLDGGRLVTGWGLVSMKGAVGR